MRIGTWNLDNDWSSQHSNLLKRQKCDVWLLTEVPPGAVSSDGMIAGFNCHFSSAVMDCGQHWAAVLSRQPLSPLADPHAASAVAIVDCTTYCSTVLPWKTAPHSDPWVGVQYAAKTQAAIQTVLKGLPKSDLVWGGDWNHSFIGSDWAGSKDNLGRNYLLAALKKSKLQVPTAGLAHRQGNGQYSIDHIAVPWAWEVRCACRISATGLSDHDAYVIEV